MMSCSSFMSMGKHNNMLTMVINKLEGKQEKMNELLAREFVQALLDSCGLIINSVPLNNQKMIEHYNIIFPFYL